MDRATVCFKTAPNINSMKVQRVKSLQLMVSYTTAKPLFLLYFKTQTF